MFLVLENRLLLNLLKIQPCDLGIVSVDDLDKFFKGGSLRFDVFEKDKGKFDANPALCEK